MSVNTIRGTDCSSLLGAALENLFVARDNKALLVVWSGSIISSNQLAADFCGYAPGKLINQGLLAVPSYEPAIVAGALCERWDAIATTADGAQIPVAVVRERLGYQFGDVLVYALRDLRERNADLLAVALESLFVGRDRKALIVARAGTIISVNALASELCGCAPHTLIDKCLLTEFFDEPAESALSPDRRLERWGTTLKTAAGNRIPVEIVREPLGTRFNDVLVYAVRNLREHNGVAPERHFAKV